MSVSSATLLRPASGARRYSRFVGLMRFMLPATAVALILILVAWPHLSGSGGFIVPMFSGGKLVVDDAMRMHNPRYVGVSGRDQPFEVTARTAVFDPADPNRIVLNDMIADVVAQSARDVKVTAVNGIYNRKAQKLDLSGGIELTTSDGYRFVTQSARVNLNEGEIVGLEPIAGGGLAGDIESERFRIGEGGNVLRFLGNVKVTVKPRRSEESSS